MLKTRLARAWWHSNHKNMLLHEKMTCLTLPFDNIKTIGNTPPAVAYILALQGTARASIYLSSFT
jgi:hypothetical protein